MNLSTARRETGEDPVAIELLTLRRATRDIVAISSLPAIWTLHSPSQVADSLVETLYHCLGLEFAYAEFIGPNEKAATAYAKNGFLKQSTLAKLANDLAPWGKAARPVPLTSEVPNPLGEGSLSLAVTSIGPNFKNGMVIVGRKRTPFPLETERLVLNIAANQAGTTVQQKWAHEQAEKLRLRAEEGERRLKVALEIAEGEKHKLETVFDSSPAFVAVLNGPDFVFEKVNDRYYELIGHRDILGKKLADALPEVLNQGFVELLTEVLRTGETFTGSEMLVDLQRVPGTPRERRFVDLVYQRISSDGGTFGIYAHGFDVTEKVLARKAVENERQNFRNLFNQTPEMVCILRGPEHVFEFVNEAHIRALGFDATGQSIQAAQSESIEVHSVLDRVFQTGETAHLYETPVTVTGRVRHFNFTFSARRDERENICGIMLLGIEITEQVAARRKLEASQARFRDLAESLPILVWISDAQGNTTYFNKRWHELTGLSWETATAKGWVSSLHPEDREGALAAWRGSVAAGTPYEYEERVQRASDGQYRWHLARGIPIRDQRGEIAEWFGTLTDIHDQVNARREIVETIESMSDSFLYVDRDWKIIRCNKQYETITKMRREEQIGKHFLELFFSKASDRRTKLWVACQEAMAQRTPVYIEDFYEPLQIWTANNIYPQRDGGLTFFSRDITNQKESEEALKRAVEARDTFLGIASHELRTPLTSMRLQSQINQRVYDKQGPSAFTPERIRKLIENPLIQTDRLSRLVDDMLDISRIASGKLSMSFERINVSTLVTDTLQRFAPQLEAVGCSLVLEIEERVTADADAFRFEQVITNLVTNAVKYAPGSAVEISLHQHPGEIVLRFRDYGPGIAKDKAGRVFERFERLVTPNKVSGLGLGLHISKEIIEAHGGSIRLVSELGQGAEFIVCLPVVQKVVADD